MSLYRCPHCLDPSGEFEVLPAKEKFKWHEFSSYRSLCKHCGAEVALDENFQKWGLLILPAIVIFVWDVALANQGGVYPLVKYLSLALAVLGFVMLFIKRKMVVVKPPDSNRSRAKPE